ncbi:interleukin-18 receptor 1-like [Scleropages formosus]|uniref:Interleukin-18 receptor 1-like n=1 Tax=Scleropages formosus TaxID=113540 RepID=A0A0P7VQF4_SCLFO|nr:interleukin-18 receptor 1-like [Scleropages formosus]
MVCLTAAAGGHAGVKHPVYAREGEVVALRCPLPNTSNKSSVIWNVNTTQGLQELREESGSLLKQYNGTLLMLKVMKNDSGMYCCSKRVRSVLLSLGLVGICVISVAVVTVICYKMKIYIVLFFRDLWEVPSSSADGKQYDAYISYYNTCSEEALSEEEITLLLDTMETKYGFQLCVYHRDVLPGGAMVDAVLEHVKQSRRLILVPREQGPQAEDQYGLWNGLHAALVDRYTRLVFIQKAPCNSLDSLPEPLCMLAHSGDAITWKGSRSAHHSSAFWKHLLYHMPPRRKHQEERLTLL